MAAKQGKIPVEHEVIWEFGPGAAFNAIWYGEWRKRWLCGYEWKLTYNSSFTDKPKFVTEWKPVSQIIFGREVTEDLIEHNIKLK